MHHPARFRNLERIRALDPERDDDEILRITSRLDFAWDYTQGTGIAFLRDHEAERFAFDPAARRLAEASLRIARQVAPWPPRRTPYRHRPTTYSHGYGLGDLGPASMLDDLDDTSPRTGAAS